MSYLKIYLILSLKNKVKKNKTIKNKPTNNNKTKRKFSLF